MPLDVPAGKIHMVATVNVLGGLILVINHGHGYNGNMIIRLKVLKVGVFGFT